MSYSGTTAIAIPLSAVVCFLLILLCRGDAQYADSRFRTNPHWGKHVEVYLSPMATVPEVRSTLECCKYCSRHPACAALVKTPEDRKCKLYAAAVTSSTQVTASPLAVYLEKVNVDAAVTDVTFVPATSSPTPDCSTITSCDQLAPTAAFRHRDGSYILVYGKDFWVYKSVDDMCWGRPVAGPSNLHTLIEGFTRRPDMAASTNDGQDLFMFQSGRVYCFQYNATTLTYQTCDSWKWKSIADTFGSNMPSSPHGHCFLSRDTSHGYLFNDLDIIYSNGATWNMKDSDPNNPFYMEVPGNTVEACTETQDPNYFLFFEGEKIYVYDATRRVGTYVGKCCKSL